MKLYTGNSGWGGGGVMGGFKPKNHPCRRYGYFLEPHSESRHCLIKNSATLLHEIFRDMSISQFKKLLQN